MGEITKSDINFQEVQKWYDDTDIELKDVGTLLDDFKTTIEKIGKVDTVTEIISKIGEDIGNAYNVLKNAFNTAMTETKKMIKKWK